MSIDLRRFRSAFSDCDLHKSIAAIGGMLTLPELQANTLRLEVLAHMALANCKGRRSPTLANAAKWFKLTGKCLGHLEDPIEDVFTSRVIFMGKNYRVFEGIYEANGFQLQHILHAVEEMPDHGEFVKIKQSCEALLVLSELLCSHAGIDAFALGTEQPLMSLPIQQIPTMKQLASLTTLSYLQLDAAGCDVKSLNQFVQPLDNFRYNWSENLQSTFYKQPLLDTGKAIIAALPSVFSAALRETVIKTCIEIGNTLEFRSRVLGSQFELLKKNPILRKAKIPLATAHSSDTAIVSSQPVEIEPGYWIHCLLLLDDLKGFENGGIRGEHSLSISAAPILQQEIEITSTYCRAQSGFKAGFSAIVIFGFGRIIGELELVSAPDWYIKAASDYDLNVMGWQYDFDFPELFKLCTMERDLNSKGFTFINPNGLIAMLGWSHKNRGHLVPHEKMSLDFQEEIIVIPKNSHLELRADHHRRLDIQSIANPDNSTSVIQCWNYDELSRGHDLCIYIDQKDFQEGKLRGVWLCKPRTWWVIVSNENIIDTGFLNKVWIMQCVWIERIAKILVPALPSAPAFLVWRLNFSNWEKIPVADVVPATPEEIERNITTTYEVGSATIETDIGPAFYWGLFRPDNTAELALLHSFVKQVVHLCEGNNQSIEDYMAKIVPSPDARQMHAFDPQDFREHMQSVIAKPPVIISRFDDAAIQIGLNWQLTDRPRGTFQGKKECCIVLNQITSAVEVDLCQELAKYERYSLVKAAVSNHEAAAFDKSIRLHTSAALISLADNKSVVMRTIEEHQARLNSVTVMSRILIEAGLSECPQGTGMMPADIDLSRLMAKARMIYYLGGYSDAIYYGAMKPEVRISPAGEVMIDPTFFDTIVEPTGRSLVDNEIEMHRDRYPSYLQELDIEARPLEESLDVEFLEAWEQEVGVSLVDCKDILQALCNRLVNARCGWETIPRPELITFLENLTQDPEAYLAGLESIPRTSWMDIPTGYEDQDRWPWRFRRRLGLYRRPLLRLSDSNDALMMIVPGLLCDSLRVMMLNYYAAEMDQEYLNSTKMRKWWNHVKDRDAKQFEETVCIELKKIGWQCKSRKKFSEILGKGLHKNPGDIDVLAWRTDGRIIVIECKNLQFAKTPSEIAKQLSKFQNSTDENGRPDLLAKHLNRVELAREHIAKFREYTGVQTGVIEGALVFSTQVPMVFQTNINEHSARFLRVDQLTIL